MNRLISSEMSSGSFIKSVIERPVGFIWLIGGYSALHFLLRILFSPVIGTDDINQAIYAQTLSLGYETRQPPLYTWLQWGTDHLVGIGVHSHAFLKYLLLFATYLFLYRIGCIIFSRHSTAVIASISLWLTFPFAVSIHQGVTHSILLSALIAATVYVFLKLERRPSLQAYILLGLVLGLGIISKYGFIIFAGAFILAALTLPSFRRVILDHRMLLTAIVVLLICLPPLTWLVDRQDEHTAALEALGPVKTQSISISTRATNMFSLASSITQFLAPLWLFLLIFFPKALRKPAPDSYADNYMLLLGRTILIALSMLAIAMIFGLLGKVQPRWMHAFLLLFPLYFFARAEKAYPDGVAKPGYIASLITIPLIVIALWAGQTYLGPSVGKATRFHAPYDLISTHLRQAEYPPSLIIAGDEYLAGNLRLGLPDSRVIAANFPFYPAAPMEGTCLIIWNSREGKELPSRLGKFLAGTAYLSAESIHTWKAPYHHSSKDFLEVTYLTLPRKECKTSPE